MRAMHPQSISAALAFFQGLGSTGLRGITVTAINDMQRREQR
jgi:hypothetical protein